MKSYKELTEEIFLEGHNRYPGDDMTMKELKIAVNAAKNIIDMLEDGASLQRWQISAIVVASDELASVCTSMRVDHEEEMENDEMEMEMEYDEYGYPSMYEEVDVNKTELKAAIDAGKKNGKIASVEAVKYIRSKHGLTHTRAHNIWKNIRREINEEYELD